MYQKTFRLFFHQTESIHFNFSTFTWNSTLYFCYYYIIVTEEDNEIRKKRKARSAMDLFVQRNSPMLIYCTTYLQFSKKFHKIWKRTTLYFSEEKKAAKKKMNPPHVKRYHTIHLLLIINNNSSSSQKD